MLPSPDHELLHSANRCSECTGSTHISEDSSEIAFLLVENYQLTASVGLRIGREYLENLKEPFHQTLAAGLDTGEEQDVVTHGDIGVECLRW